MGGYWKKLAWIWVWRHVGLCLAPRPLGIDGAMLQTRRDKSRNLLSENCYADHALAGWKSDNQVK
jgi:hypothetical protein